MKLKIAFLVLIFALLIAAPAMAQEKVDRLDLLEVAIWPDYDRAETLVLITGHLPSDAAMPAEVAVPLPDGATLNAVARIEPSGNMIADLLFHEDVVGKLTITLNVPTFRVEYYIPYESEGSLKSGSFDWQADYLIEEFTVQLQQPSAATEFNVQGQAATASDGADGLRYFTTEPRSLTFGEPFHLDFEYLSASGQLTAGESPASLPTQVESVSAAASGGFNSGDIATIVIAVGVVLLVAVAVLYFTGQQKSRRVRRTRPSRRPATPGGTGGKFCRSCGNELELADRFCASCGKQAH